MSTSCALALAVPIIPLALPPMDRGEQTVELADGCGPIVDSESRELSDKYGLDYSRVRRILERLAVPHGLHVRPLTFCRAFHRALKRFPPPEALALFEQVDPWGEPFFWALPHFW